MMKQNKYITIFSVFNFRKQKRIQGILENILNYVFIVIFVIYIVVSLLTIIFKDGFVINIFIKIGEILSVSASILISIIAVNISNLYNEEIMDLLNDIIETNQPLNIQRREVTIETNVIKIFSTINLCLILCLFLLITIFQIVSLNMEQMTCLDNSVRNSTSFLNILIICFNILSVADCIKSSNKYKKVITEIKKIDKELFDMYNRTFVDMKINQSQKP